MKVSVLKRIYWRLTGVIMLAVISALLASSWFSHRAFEQNLVPEVARKAASVATSARALIMRAVELGIPFHELYGVDQTFAEMQEENPEFGFLAITDPAGQVLFRKGDAPKGFDAYARKPVLSLRTAEETGGERIVIDGISTQVSSLHMVSVPLGTSASPLGTLHIGIDDHFVDKIVLEMLLDVVVVLVVALFFTLELLNFIAGARLESGLRSLDGILQRGSRGDFTTLPKDDTHAEFGGVIRLLEATAARVNAGFMALTRDIEAARRDPAHERKDGLQAANAGLQALREKFRFGYAAETQPDVESRLAQVRAPLFAFILAEELTRSFLPGYVKSLLVPVPGLPPEIVVGLPIVLFMLIVALGQPHLGALSERIGHRTAMLTGACIAVAGFVASAFAGSVLDLLIWRSLCAVGYGLVFVAAQGLVLAYTTSTSRARGFAMFVGAIMVATVCGPSIGGILADNVGERATFIVSALLALASILAIRLLPELPTRQPSARQTGAPRFVEILSLLVKRRFVTLTGLAAIPAKIMLTGVCFYLMPLYVVTSGESQAMAGRILMAYAVVMVLVAPLASALAHSRSNREWLVGAGLLVSGLGGMLLLVSGDVGWVLAAVVVIGLGQSLSITAQSALVSDHCEREIAQMGDHTVYGVYRLLERLGNAVGPLIAGSLVIAIGYQKSFVAIGALVLACGVLFMLATLAGRAPAYATAE